MFVLKNLIKCLGFLTPLIKSESEIIANQFRMQINKEKRFRFKPGTKNFLLSSCWWSTSEETTSLPCVQEVKLDPKAKALQ